MAVDLVTYENSPVTVPYFILVNGASNGEWSLGASNIIHDNDIGSWAKKSFPELTIGKTYKITYTINSYGSCEIIPYLGDSVGVTRDSVGTFVDILTLTGANKTLSFYASGDASINYYKIEELVTVLVDSPLGVGDMVNNSWTLSFNPILNQWISFHSYLPNNYLTHPTKLLAKSNDSDLYINNSGEYGKYFNNTIKPFIIETIFNEYKTDTKVFDSITVIMDTEDENGVPINDFMSSGVVYTEMQCSGTISFGIESNVTKKEKNWNFNQFLDITNNVSQKIFVSDWDSVSSSYPIDKIVNVNRIDDDKPWYQRGRMRDKYLAVRFKESNIDNTKFTLKFVVSSFRASKR